MWEVNGGGRRLTEEDDGPPYTGVRLAGGEGDGGNGWRASSKHCRPPRDASGDRQLTLEPSPQRRWAHHASRILTLSPHACTLDTAPRQRQCQCQQVHSQYASVRIVTGAHLLSAPAAPRRIVRRNVDLDFLRWHLTPHSNSLRYAPLDGVFVSITPGDPSLWVGVLFVRKGT